jgi:WD40 repeat protein
VPSGRIYASWHRPGGRQQPWVYDFQTNGWARVPIWFAHADQPHVDTAGSTMLFAPPTNDLIMMSLEDSTQLETWPKSQPVFYQPRLSQDGGRVVASLTAGQSSDILLFERTSRRETMIAQLDGVLAASPVHWFAGGDSLLLRGSVNSSWRYFVIGTDGSTPRLFNFTPAVGAPIVAITNSGNRIAIGHPVDPSHPNPDGEENDFRIAVYDLVRGALLREFVLPHKVGDLAWSPGGRWLAHSPVVGSLRQVTLEILDVQTGERRTLVPLSAGPEYARSLTWIR